MAGATSLEAVKRKIKSLQDQADGAEERAERLQKELLAERKAREQVSMFTARGDRQELLIKMTHHPLVAFLVYVCSVELIRSEIAGFLRCKLSSTWHHAVPPHSTLVGLIACCSRLSVYNW